MIILFRIYFFFTFEKLIYREKSFLSLCGLKIIYGYRKFKIQIKTFFGLEEVLAEEIKKLGKKSRIKNRYNKL